MKNIEKNVLGTTLDVCSLTPLTGFFREGNCRMPSNDIGRHGVCAQLTKSFLTFTRNRGNDLTTPHPLSGFPGLVPGDRWCLCVDRWIEAHDNGVAPPVILAATHAEVAQSIPLDRLTSLSLDDLSVGDPGHGGVRPKKP